MRYRPFANTDRKPSCDPDVKNELIIFCLMVEKQKLARDRAVNDTDRYFHLSKLFDICDYDLVCGEIYVFDDNGAFVNDVEASNKLTYHYLSLLMDGMPTSHDKSIFKGLWGHRVGCCLRTVSTTSAAPHSPPPSSRAWRMWKKRSGKATKLMTTTLTKK